MSLAIGGFKECPKCKQIKSVNEFYNSKSRSDGYSCYCKKCMTEQRKRRRKKEEEKYEKEHIENGISEDGVKRCSKCGEIKPLTDFNHVIKYKDGHSRWCKECMNKSSIERQKRYKKQNDKNSEKEGQKYCPLCESLKPYTDFYTNRRTKDGHTCYCKECTDKYQKEQYKIHYDRINRSHRKWVENNRDKTRQYSARYKEKHREEVLEKYREYRKTHVLERVNYDRERYFKKKNISDGTVTNESIKQMYVDQDMKCAYCGEDLTEKMKHLDHILPVSRGGMNTLSNVHWTCPKCNLRKSNKTEDEWFEDLMRSKDEHALKILCNIGLINEEDDVCPIMVSA